MLPHHRYGSLCALLTALAFLTGTSSGQQETVSRISSNRGANIPSRGSFRHNPTQVILDERSTYIDADILRNIEDADKNFANSNQKRNKENYRTLSRFETENDEIKSSPKKSKAALIQSRREGRTLNRNKSVASAEAEGSVDQITTVDAAVDRTVLRRELKRGQSTQVGDDTIEVQSEFRNRRREKGNVGKVKSSDPELSLEPRRGRTLTNEQENENPKLSKSFVDAPRRRTIISRVANADETDVRAPQKTIRKSKRRESDLPNESDSVEVTDTATKSSGQKYVSSRRLPNRGPAAWKPSGSGEESSDTNSKEESERGARLLTKTRSQIKKERESDIDENDNYPQAFIQKIKQNSAESTEQRDQETTTKQRTRLSPVISRRKSLDIGNSVNVPAPSAEATTSIILPRSRDTNLRTQLRTRANFRNRASSTTSLPDSTTETDTIVSTSKPDLKGRFKTPKPQEIDVNLVSNNFSEDDDTINVETKASSTDGSVSQRPVFKLRQPYTPKTRMTTSTEKSSQVTAPIKSVISNLRARPLSPRGNPDTPRPPRPQITNRLRTFQSSVTEQYVPRGEPLPTSAPAIQRTQINPLIRTFQSKSDTFQENVRTDVNSAPRPVFRPRSLSPRDRGDTQVRERFRPKATTVLPFKYASGFRRTTQTPLLEDRIDKNVDTRLVDGPKHRFSSRYRNDIFKSGRAGPPGYIATLPAIVSTAPSIASDIETSDLSTESLDIEESTIHDTTHVGLSSDENVSIESDSATTIFMEEASLESISISSTTASELTSASSKQEDLVSAFEISSTLTSTSQTTPTSLATQLSSEDDSTTISSEPSISSTSTEATSAQTITSTTSASTTSTSAPTSESPSPKPITNPTTRATTKVSTTTPKRVTSPPTTKAMTTKPPTTVTTAKSTSVKPVITTTASPKISTTKQKPAITSTVTTPKPTTKKPTTPKTTPSTTSAATRKASPTTARLTTTATTSTTTSATTTTTTTPATTPATTTTTTPATTPATTTTTTTTTTPATTTTTTPATTTTTTPATTPATATTTTPATTTTTTPATTSATTPATTPATTSATTPTSIYEQPTTPFSSNAIETEATPSSFRPTPSYQPPKSPSSNELSLSESLVKSLNTTLIAIRITPTIEGRFAVRVAVAPRGTLSSTLKPQTTTAAILQVSPPQSNHILTPLSSIKRMDPSDTMDTAPEIASRIALDTPTIDQLSVQSGNNVQQNEINSFSYFTTTTPKVITSSTPLTPYPFVIYGIFPNNTVFRKYPNTGVTEIVDEREIARREPYYPSVATTEVTQPMQQSTASSVGQDVEDRNQLSNQLEPSADRFGGTGLQNDVNSEKQNTPSLNPDTSPVVQNLVPRADMGIQENVRAQKDKHNNTNDTSTEATTEAVASSSVTAELQSTNEANQGPELGIMAKPDVSNSVYSGQDSKYNNFWSSSTTEKVQLRFLTIDLVTMKPEANDNSANPLESSTETADAEETSSASTPVFRWKPVTDSGQEPEGMKDEAESTTPLISNEQQPLSLMEFINLAMKADAADSLLAAAPVQEATTTSTTTTTTVEPTTAATTTTTTTPTTTKPASTTTKKPKATSKPTTKKPKITTTKKPTTTTKPTTKKPTTTTTKATTTATKATTTTTTTTTTPPPSTTTTATTTTTTTTTTSKPTTTKPKTTSKPKATPKPTTTTKKPTTTKPKTTKKPKATTTKATTTTKKPTTAKPTTTTITTTTPSPSTKIMIVTPDYSASVQPPSDSDAYIDDVLLLNNLLRGQAAPPSESSRTGRTHSAQLLLANQIIELALMRAATSTSPPGVSSSTEEDQRILQTIVSPNESSPPVRNLEVAKPSSEADNELIAVPVSGQSAATTARTTQRPKATTTRALVDLSSDELFASLLNPSPTNPTNKQPPTMSSTGFRWLLQALANRNRSNNQPGPLANLLRSQGTSSDGLRGDLGGLEGENVDGIPASTDPGLLSAAINVTRAVSQFMGYIIQGAAESFQNYIRQRTGGFLTNYFNLGVNNPTPVNDP